MVEAPELNEENDAANVEETADTETEFAEITEE